MDAFKLDQLLHWEKLILISTTYTLDKNTGRIQNLLQIFLMIEILFILDKKMGRIQDLL